MDLTVKGVANVAGVVLPPVVCSTKLSFESKVYTIIVLYVAKERNDKLTR
jgi:hypothetical protein